MNDKPLSIIYSYTAWNNENWLVWVLVKNNKVEIGILGIINNTIKVFKNTQS